MDNGTRMNGFDCLSDLPDHSEQALLAAGHTEPDIQDGNTVFLETLYSQDCTWTEPFGGPACPFQEGSGKRMENSTEICMSPSLKWFSIWTARHDLRNEFRAFGDDAAVTHFSIPNGWDFHRARVRAKLVGKRDDENPVHVWLSRPFMPRNPTCSGLENKCQVCGRNWIR